MEPVSTHAKRARANTRDRYYTRDDLEQFTGVSTNNAYLVTNNDNGTLTTTDYTGDFIMVVTDITHRSHTVTTNTGLTAWYRSHGTTEPDFTTGIIVHADFYPLHITDRTFTIDDDTTTPITTNAPIPQAALSAFRRKPLTPASPDNTFTLDPAP